MYPTRAYGHLRPPTPEQVAEYAQRHGLTLSATELEEAGAFIAGTLQGIDRLEELEPSPPPLKHFYRDPGRAPLPDEDPYNAVIRFCDVRGAADGPLSGRTLGVKDCIAVAGVPMTNGGRRQPVFVPTEDAVVIERLLDAGVTITAKTNLEDLGMGLGEGSYYGASRNPLDTRFSTGGSSSGSGAAVASGLVDLALGADEGGSVRIPSAWCGLVGMKATHGLVPSYGMAYMDHTIDHIGPMTTTVADNALMLEIMAGHDWRDPQWVRSTPTAGNYTGVADRGIEGLRIGVLAESLGPVGATDDVIEAFEQATETLAGLGATIVPVSIPLWAESSTLTAALMFGLWAMGRSGGAGYGHLGRIDPDLVAHFTAQKRLSGTDLPPFLRTMLLTVEHLSDMYLGVHYAKAQNLRLELRRQVTETFESVDLMVTPTTPIMPFELLNERASAGEVMGRMPFSATSNTSPTDLSGHPALTIPCGTGAYDLPVGLQIIGSHFDEELVYQAAFAYESVSTARPLAALAAGRS
jgi:amidase